MHRKASWEFKREGTPPHNKCRHASIGLSSGIHLGKSLSMHLGKDPWMSQVWRKNQDNWPEVNKDPEGLSYISGWRCLCTVPLLAKSRQSCPTLCDPINSSPPDSLVPGILQARTLLEWVAISFSNAWKWKVKVKSLSCVQPSATPWTAALQAPPSMGFSRQEYWSGVPLPSPCSSLLLPKCVLCLVSDGLCSLSFRMLALLSRYVSLPSVWLTALLLFFFFYCFFLIFFLSPPL